ncbi:MAG: cobalamin biosynthesis protein [Rhodobacteraceae bacterium]|nr:cobalamin biosynthesis protein [Paracoccaceae bacterium]MBR9821567.1 cobalamin biosynthesis protein [Paracoccaceae bacterium]
MIVAGFGYRGTTTPEALAEALRLAAGARRVDAIATPADKAATPAFRSFVETLSLPLCRVPARALQEVETLTQSMTSRAARGTGSVAEASALASLAPGARLLGPRVISTDRSATCALAEGDPL